MIDKMNSSSYWYVATIYFISFGPRWSKSLQFDVAIALYLVFDAVV